MTTTEQTILVGIVKALVVEVRLRRALEKFDRLETLAEGNPKTLAKINHARREVVGVLVDTATQRAVAQV